MTSLLKTGLSTVLNLFGLNMAAWARLLDCSLGARWKFKTQASLQNRILATLFEHIRLFQ